MPMRKGRGLTIWDDSAFATPAKNDTKNNYAHWSRGSLKWTNSGLRYWNTKGKHSAQFASAPPLALSYCYNSSQLPLDSISRQSVTDKGDFNVIICWRNYFLRSYFLINLLSLKSKGHARIRSNLYYMYETCPTKTTTLLLLL